MTIQCSKISCFFYAGLCSLTLYFLLGCSENKEGMNVHKRIEQYEDSIRQWGGGQGMPSDRINFADRYINILLQAYKDEPNHPKTPEYLDRLHMWYATKRDTKNAVKWAEYVVEKFPKYENRPMLIESIAIMYDNEILPRDTNKVRQYYTQLLREYSAIKPADKNAIEERLKYNHLSLQEYILNTESEDE